MLLDLSLQLSYVGSRSGDGELCLLGCAPGFGSFENVGRAEQQMEERLSYGANQKASLANSRGRPSC